MSIFGEKRVCARVAFAPLLLLGTGWSAQQEAPSVPAVVSPGSKAVSPEVAAAREYAGRALIVRGSPAGRELRFDSSGKLLSPAAPVDWTLAGFELESVSEGQTAPTDHQSAPSGPQLELAGHQVAIGYNADAHIFERHLLKDRPVRITLPEPPGADQVRAALDRIFSTGIDPELERHMPPWWVHYFLPAAEWSAGGPGDELSTLPANSIAGAGGKPLDAAIVRPRVVSQEAPAYTEEARANRIQGKLMLGMVVDRTGRPVRIRVVRPLGFGLDAKAVEAVGKWRFEPATLNGAPLPVEIRLEINMAFVPQAPPSPPAQRK